jgi:hypothetical protein
VTETPPLHPYDVAYRRRMEAFAPGLWADLGRVPALPPETGRAVLAYLLELACQAQHIRNIELGRAALAGLPRRWLLARIEAAAAPLLRLQDEWEYRRLLELYERLDPGLWRRLVAWGRRSPVAAIRAAAAAALDGGPGPT